MENIIKKAIKGGWSDGVVGDENWRFHVVCDPLFWQSLRKACDWENKNTDWRDEAIHFHRLNLIQGWDKAVSWLEELINK